MERVVLRIHLLRQVVRGVDRDGGHEGYQLAIPRDVERALPAEDPDVAPRDQHGRAHLDQVDQLIPEVKQDAPRGIPDEIGGDPVLLPVIAGMHHLFLLLALDEDAQREVLRQALQGLHRYDLRRLLGFALPHDH